MRARSTATTWSEAQSKAILTELDRILGTPLFAHAERQRRFLKFIVTETLAGRADRISGYTVGIGVYDRDHGFEPMLDPIVRVEAGRLRAKLREYYDGEGQFDPIRIGLDKGSYAATIRGGGLALVTGQTVRRLLWRAWLRNPRCSCSLSPVKTAFLGGTALPMASPKT